MIRPLLILTLIISFPVLARDFKIGLASNFSELNTFTFNPFGGYFKDAVAIAMKDNQDFMKKAGINIILQNYDYGADDLNVPKQVHKASGEKVSAVVGYSYSSSALLAAPLHVKYKIPMLSPSASANRLGTFGKYVHLGSFDNSYMSKVLAKLVVKELGKRKVLIIQAANCAYCMDLANSFESEVRLLGGAVTARVSVLQGDKNFDKVATETKNLNFDAVFVPNQELTSARIISSFLNTGVNVPFIGADGWGNEGKEFFSILKGRKFEGYSTSHWHSSLETAKSKKFVEAYKAEFSQMPNDTSALTYDAISLLIQALAKAKSPSPEDVDAALASIKSFEGVTGKYSMFPNKAPLKDILILKTTNNGFKVDRLISAREKAPL